MTAGILKKKFGKHKPPDTPQDDEDYASFFSRSDETFKRTAAVLAAKKRDEEAAKKRRPGATEVAGDVFGPVEKQTTEEPKGRKRIRLSPDRDGDKSISVESNREDIPVQTGLEPPAKILSENTGLAAFHEESKISDLLNSESMDSIAGPKMLPTERKTVVVDLESGSEEEIVPASQNVLDKLAAKEKPFIVSEEEYETESDPELLELSRRAREKARNQYSTEDTKPPPAATASLSDDLTPFGIAGSASSVTVVAPNGQEPIVHYLIDSSIPGTRPLITARKFSQRLKESRLHWCHQQGFPDETTKKVVLTFKKIRIYDSTSCKGLGFEIVNGNIMRRNEPRAIYKNKVHLVAMMEEDARKLEENRRRQIVQDERPEHLALAEKTKDDPPIRLVLRSQGLEDFKVKAKPTNKLSRLLDAFRQSKCIPDDVSISMSFDGETILPESLVSDYEFEDLDAIDVTLKVTM